MCVRMRVSFFGVVVHLQVRTALKVLCAHDMDELLQGNVSRLSENVRVFFGEKELRGGDSALMGTPTGCGTLTDIMT